MRKKVIKVNADFALDFIVYATLIFVFIVTLYPFINTLAISLNDANDTIKGGIKLIPRVFTTYNYYYILTDASTYRALLVSVLRTVMGTVLALASTTVISYVLSRKNFVLRRPVIIIFLLTMYFDGGIIPTYFLYKNLGVINKFSVYIVPFLINAFYIVLLKSFMEGLSDSFVESAKIDGASELRIIVNVIVPLSLPALATIALYIAVAHWNSWLDTFLYASGNKNLYTLQYKLRQILQSTQQTVSSAPDYSAAVTGTATVTTRSIRAAMTITAVVPILVVYPLLQKYFVHGLTLGGLKG